jgi:hypothetical protein
MPHWSWWLCTANASLVDGQFWNVFLLRVISLILLTLEEHTWSILRLHRSQKLKTISLSYLDWTAFSDHLQNPRNDLLLTKDGAVGGDKTEQHATVSVRSKYIEAVSACVCPECNCGHKFYRQYRSSFMKSYMNSSPLGAILSCYFSTPVHPQYKYGSGAILRHGNNNSFIQGSVLYGNRYFGNVLL